MRRIIFVMLCSMFALNSVQVQELPDFVQPRLDSVKAEMKRSLMDLRIGTFDPESHGRFPRFLSYSGAFSKKEVLLLDSLGANLSIGMNL